MKHEKLIVAALLAFLFALAVAAVFASRVPPKGVTVYTPRYAKPVPVEVLPAAEQELNSVIQ